ncbi:MAG: hypothetical protein MJ153_06985 [Clostridia bacterium]|nr:hypothetical protein [Clostridia bacterium]
MKYVPDIPGQFYRTDEHVPSADELWNRIAENGASSLVEFNRNVLSKSVGGTISTVLLVINLIGIFAGVILRNGPLTGVLVASFLIILCLSVLIVNDASRTKSEIKKIRFVVSVFLGIIVITAALAVLGVTGIWKLQPVAYCRIAIVGCIVAAVVVGVWVYFNVYRMNAVCSSSGTATVVGFVDKLYFARRDVYRDVLTIPVYEITHAGKQYLVYGEHEYRIGGNGFAVPKLGSSQRVSFNPFDPYECHFEEQYKAPDILKGLVVFFLIAALCAYFASMALA